MKSYLAALPLLVLPFCAVAQEASTKPVPQFGSCAKPEWPKEALRHEYQGTVTLAFLIGADGAVRQSRIEKSSGYELLDLAAQEGMKRCTFKPATQNGQPVETWTKMQYVWTLGGPSPQATAAALESASAGAERGEPEAQLKLALIYLNGQGVKQDLAEGRNWLLKAAEQGSAGAQETLGMLAMPRQGNQGDPAQALAWLTKAAEQGKANSQYLLAILLRQQSKNTESVAWLRKAASQNHAAAQAAVAATLLGGGQQADLPEAIALLNKAAAQNDRNAQIMLAECYEKGTGVAQDYAQAAVLYQRAAAANNPRAQLALARLYDNGQGVEKDIDKARQLREQSIRK